MITQQTAAIDTNFKVLMALMGLEIGGAETHVLELCKALSKKGVDVYVASNGGAYESELKAFGIKHFHVPMHNKSPRNLLTSYASLKRIITENNIKLVHAHGRIPAFLCGLLVKRMRFRFVTTAHLNFKTSFPYNILSNWGEKCLAVSLDIKDYLMHSYSVPADDILITINGIDTDKFSPDVDFSPVVDEFGLDRDKLHIVSTSRMDKDRSLVAHSLIECAADLYAENPGIEIILVGGGDDFNEVQKKAAAMNKKIGRNVIILTGNRIDVNRFVSLADIYVNVSRGALEAMAAARPCIVAGNQGYIGIFDESRLSICEDTNFCCRGCPDTTAERIKADVLALMRMSADERQQLGEYGRKTIMESYSPGRMADDALKLYSLVSRSTRTNDVLISGYYGFKNNGDETVLKAIVDSLRDVQPDISITALSMRPRATSEMYGILAINRYNIPAIWRELKRTNLLITGGGSLVQDLTSTRSLLYYLMMITAGIKAGAKTMLFANGIGPVNQPRNKERVRQTLNRVDLITVRDERSAKVLKDLGVTEPPVYNAADIAFAISHTDAAAAEKRMTALGAIPGKYFCVSVRSWKTLSAGFERSLAALSDYIAEKYGMTAVFIPMQPLNDEEISKRIMALMTSRAIFFGTDYGLDEILGAVGGAELVIGMRLHTIIYAAKADVPVIGLVYDPKVKVMMEMLEQRFYMDVAEVDIDVLKTYADEIMTDKDILTDKIRSAAAAAAERALLSTRLAVDLINRREF